MPPKQTHKTQTSDWSYPCGKYEHINSQHLVMRLSMTTFDTTSMAVTFADILNLDTSGQIKYRTWSIWRHLEGILKRYPSSINLRIWNSSTINFRLEIAYFNDQQLRMTISNNVSSTKQRMKTFTTSCLAPRTQTAQKASPPCLRQSSKTVIRVIRHSHLILQWQLSSIHGWNSATHDRGTTLIVWHQLLLGYTSKLWRLLAWMDPINKEKLNLSVGRSKIHTALKAMTLMIR